MCLIAHYTPNSSPSRYKRLGFYRYDQFPPMRKQQRVTLSLRHSPDAPELAPLSGCGACFLGTYSPPHGPPLPPGYSWGIRYRQAYPPLYPHAPGVRCPIVCAISSATIATDRQRCSIGLRRAARAAKCFLKKRKLKNSKSLK